MTTGNIVKYSIDQWIKDSLKSECLYVMYGIRKFILLRKKADLDNRCLGKYIYISINRNGVI